MHIPFLKGLSRSQLGLLAPLMESYTCPAGAVVFEQGDPATFLFLIVSGSVEIRYKPYDGPRMTLTHLHAGDVFGWSSVVGSRSYASAVHAESELQAIRIHGEDLRQLCDSHPRVGAVIVEKLADVVTPRWKNAKAQIQVMLTKRRSHRKLSRSAARQNPITSQHSREQQLRGLISQISAYIEQYHGGQVDFVSFGDNRLRVRLGGACLGCPLVPATLHGWVAGTVHQFFPDVEVEAD